MKPVIVHISSDYPDPLRPDKTQAVRNLVEGTPEFRHVVYSLNRVNGWGGIADIPFGVDRIAISYGALPKGLLWERRLAEVATWIATDLKKKKIVPDLVQAHKFTVEGLIGEQLTAEFCCPLVCGIQGNTDVKILYAKIGLRARYRALAKTAVLVFPFAPWMQKPFEELVGLSPDKCRYLPVVPGLDSLTPVAPVGADKLVSVFNLDLWKIKNLAGLIKAVEMISKRRPGLTLDIYGGGKAIALLKIQAMIARAGLENHIALKGSVPNTELPGILKNYAAFVMPTLFETYGLVFIEALFSGLPVLYSRNRGIDGYFDPSSIGYVCDPKSVIDIVRGIDYLLTNEAELKRGIGIMQTEGRLDFVCRDAILKTYREGLLSVLAGQTNNIRVVNA